MRDFNTVKSDLVKHLQLTFQADDGRIYWYDGTLESLWEFMKVAFFNGPADASDMDSFIRIFEEDDEEDGMDSFIRILKD